MKKNYFLLALLFVFSMSLSAQVLSSQPAAANNAAKSAKTVLPLVLNGETSNYVDFTAYTNDERGPKNPFTPPTGGSKAPWGLKFNRTVPADGVLAVGWNGTHYFLPRWGSANCSRYNADGTSAGADFAMNVSGTRGMAYDGTHFYCGNATNTIRKYDFSVIPPTQVGTITTPSGITVRHITYDPTGDGGAGSLWIGNWDNNHLVQIKMDGTEIKRFAAGTNTAFHSSCGTAFDNVSAGGPFLWAINADGLNVTVKKFLLSNLTLVDTYSLQDAGYCLLGASGGGMFLAPNMLGSANVLMAVLQNDKLLGWDLNQTIGLPNDLKVVSTTLANNIPNTGNYTIAGTVQNVGTVPITSYTINYKIDGGAAVSMPVTGVNIAANATLAFTHTATVVPVVGAHTLTLYSTLPNGVADPVPANDTIKKNYTVFDPTQTYPRYLMLESFTSSTCAPCVAPNIAFKTLTDAALAAGAKLTIIKYQMSWPNMGAGNNGDPYYTAEGGVRRSLYSLNSVPWLYRDGTQNSNTGSLTADMLTDGQAVPAFVKVEGTYSVAGKKVTAQVKVDAKAAVAGANLRLFVAIYEKSTIANVGSNGETKFYNVMKKFMPDASGIAITGGLTVGTTYTQDLEWEFKGNYRLPNDAQDPINHAIEHSVEDFDNLVVVAWVQNTSTFVVYNSGTMVGGGGGGDCNPATGLTAVHAATGNQLNWVNPASKADIIISQGGNYNNNGVGAGTSSFGVYHRFLPADLTAVANGQLNKVTFAPMYGSQTGAPTHSYEIRIYKGGSAAPYAPGTQIGTQAIPQASITFQQENTFALTTPITVDATQELWIGYHCTSLGTWTAQYPAGSDAGPRKEGLGNMMFFGGSWTTLYTLATSLNTNWCIKGTVTPGSGPTTTVNVFRDGAVVASAVTGASYFDTYDPTAAACYTVQVNCAAGGTSAQSNQACVDATGGDCDPATGLTAVKVGATNKLDWTMPAGKGGKETIFDGAETHTNFAMDSPGTLGWKYYGNGGPTYGFTGITFPGTGTAFSYIVFVPSATTPVMDPGTTPGIQPRTGAKYFASFANTTMVNNGWIVSPQLNSTGDITFSFYAKTYMSDYGLERMKVRYSTTTDAQASFTNYLAGSASAYVEVPVASYTLYTYTVPATAKYVAIQCVSDDAFVFMVDDITIVTAGGGGGDEVLFEDKFDTYTAGVGVALQNPTKWTTWSEAPGGPEDPLVSAAQASSPANSVKVIGASNDLVFKIANLTTGHYKVEFDYYIPSTGPGAYFNCLKSFNGASSTWATEIYFRPNGTGYQMVGTSTATTYPIAYPINTWFPVILDMDLDKVEAKLTINGVLINTWNFSWSSNAIAGVNQLGGMNFFSSAVGQPATGGEYYLDNFKFTKVAGTPSTATVNVFRNGTQVAANVTGTTWTDATPVATSCYKVRVNCAAGGTSAMSNEACVEVTGDCNPVTNFTAVKDGVNNKLTWTMPTAKVETPVYEKPHVLDPSLAGVFSNVTAFAGNNKTIVNPNHKPTTFTYNDGKKPIAKGTARIRLTAGDVWGDGSGYQFLGGTGLYGTTIPTTGPLTTSCPGSAALYALFTSKIPTNADGNCSTSNIVFNTTIFIDVASGPMDYCIANPTPGDRIWIASGALARGQNYNFEDGKEYKFSVTMSGTNDLVALEIVGGEPPPPAEDLRYCTDDIDDGVGTGSANSFSAAITFTAADLTGYVGKKITKLKIGISTAQQGISATSVWIRNTLTGANLVSKTLPLIAGWNEVTLDAPFTITAGATLALGYSCTVTGGHPLGTSTNTQNAAQGGNIAIGTAWTTLAANSIPGNLTIIGILEGGTPGAATVNIYRNNVKIVSNFTGTTYNDNTYTATINNCYKVEVNCPEGGNSAMSPEQCVNRIGVTENETSSFLIAPNPANDFINITATNNFQRVDVVNFLGQVVISQNNESNTARISVANLTKGVYFVRIKSSEGISVMKFMKQ